MTHVVDRAHGDWPFERALGQNDRFLRLVIHANAE